MSNFNLSIVLPVYNDEKTIKLMVDKIIKQVKPGLNNLEIIIVENGSFDDTSRICDKLADDYPEVTVLHHQTNLGYGRTLRDGFNKASNEIVFYADGDDQYNLNEILKALEIFKQQGADSLIGYRFSRKDGINRIIMSKVYNLLAFLMLGIRAKDINCSFKIIRKKILNNLNLSSESAFIDAEILYELKNQKANVIEMPVTHYPNIYRKSHFTNPKLTLDMLNELFKKRCNF